MTFSHRHILHYDHIEHHYLLPSLPTHAAPFECPNLSPFFLCVSIVAMFFCGELAYLLLNYMYASVSVCSSMPMSADLIRGYTRSLGALGLELQARVS